MPRGGCCCLLASTTSCLLPAGREPPSRRSIEQQVKEGAGGPRGLPAILISIYKRNSTLSQRRLVHIPAVLSYTHTVRIPGQEEKQDTLPEPADPIPSSAACFPGTISLRPACGMAAWVCGEPCSPSASLCSFSVRFSERFLPAFPVSRPRSIALRRSHSQRPWLLGAESRQPRATQGQASVTASAMEAGDNLRKLLVPITLGGAHGHAARPSAPPCAPLPPPPVLSELLVCGGAAAAEPTGEGRGAWEVSVLIVPGNPGVVMYYADYMLALRRALGGAVRNIVCLCHAGHSLAPSERLYSLEDQVDHKVAFLRNATYYLSGAETSGQCGDVGTADGPGEGHLWVLPQLPASRPSASGVSSTKWILIGHSIGAHICVEVQKRLAEQGAAGGGQQVQVVGGNPGPWQIQVIGLFPFLALNPQSQEQRALSWISHRTLLISLVASLAHALSRVVPQGLLRALIRAGLGKSWSPAAVDATRQYLLQRTVLRNYAYMGMTEFDYFGKESRASMDWDHLQRHSASCSFVFGEGDHWGPMAQYHEMRQRVPHMRLLLDQEGHPHTFCCTLAGSRSIAQLSAQICREGLFAEESREPAGL